jgi:predicted secreted acid phosphatase/exonuclease III
MKKLSYIFLCLGAIVALSGCSLTSLEAATKPSENAFPVSEVSQSKFKIATWNVEHLAYPIDQGCKPRTPAELAALQTYASGLQADVVALQEVASVEAVHLLFPEQDWQVIMSARPDSSSYECRGNGFTSTQQKVAFAIRKSVTVESVEQNTDIGLGSPGLRYGLAVKINKEGETLELLNLHLKSGCFVDDFRRSDSASCQTFAEQAPILDRWIETREERNTPYIVLGDFNHRLSAPYNRLTQILKNNSDGSASSLHIATKDLLGCHPRYPAPIDHILVGALPATLNSDRVYVHRFNDMTEEAMLSDHCAISVELSMDIPTLSPSVKWQTKSKEYQLITQAIYRQATEALLAKQYERDSWVVAMDVDETILDNSAYQVWLNMTGGSFSTESWNEWVRSGEARLVPGAKDFIETVFSAGGKVALITNREKSLDAYTWDNMLQMQIPINENNTCLVGRSKADKASMQDSRYKNDKDLRREQITFGNASCFSSSQTANSNWNKPHTIVMHIGDNIEDIDLLQQETANPTELLKRWGADIFVLPNPMYGSW